MENKWGVQTLAYNIYKIDYFKENRLVFVLPNIKDEEEVIALDDLAVFDRLVHELAIEIQERHGVSIEQASNDVLMAMLIQKNREKEELRLKISTAEQMALTDKLTGLPNRASYDHDINIEIDRFERNGEPLSLIMIDIDHFKSVNDEFGHNGGDIVLKEVAKILEANLPRKTDKIARWGGEEFIVALPETENEGARIVAERLRAAVEAGTQKLKAKKLRPVTISLGIATLNNDNGELMEGEKLQKAADDALYDSKKGGRNRVTIYKEKTDQTEKVLTHEQEIELLKEKLGELLSQLDELQADFRERTEMVNNCTNENQVRLAKKDIANTEVEISKKKEEIKTTQKELEDIEKELQQKKTETVTA